MNSPIFGLSTYVAIRRPRICCQLCVHRTHFCLQPEHKILSDSVFSERLVISEYVRRLCLWAALFFAKAMHGLFRMRNNRMRTWHENVFMVVRPIYDAYRTFFVIPIYLFRPVAISTWSTPTHTQSSLIHTAQQSGCGKLLPSYPSRTHGPWSN